MPPGPLRTVEPGPLISAAAWFSRLQNRSALKGVEDLHETWTVAVALPDFGYELRPLCLAAQRLQDRAHLAKVGGAAFVGRDVRITQMPVECAVIDVQGPLWVARGDRGGYRAFAIARLVA